MTRGWDEAAAAVFDVVPPGLLLILLLLVAAVAGALCYFFPAWVPRRLPRWRWTWRRSQRTRKTKHKRVKPAAEKVVLTTPEPADEPVAVGDLSLADRLAAEGRYAEAIRQRLRDTLHDLVAAGLIVAQPGYTAAELAAMAAGQRPDVAAPLGAATDLFSEIWYGDRPAYRDHDEHMRALTDRVRVGVR